MQLLGLLADNKLLHPFFQTLRSELLHSCAELTQQNLSHSKPKSSSRTLMQMKHNNRSHVRKVVLETPFKALLSLRRIVANIIAGVFSPVFHPRQRWFSRPSPHSPPAVKVPVPICVLVDVLVPKRGVVRHVSILSQAPLAAASA